MRISLIILAIALILNSMSNVRVWNDIVQIRKEQSDKWSIDKDCHSNEWCFVGREINTTAKELNNKINGLEYKLESLAKNNHYEWIEEDENITPAHWEKIK